jgi:glycosyltransferase involved in cell wall biosynthesis
MATNQATALVSIVMPVFNAAAYVNEAIQSILDQTHSFFELIIINDGSTDATTEIINGFSDHRIRLYSNETNRGIVYSLNLGIEKSNGKYIARMDADDIAFNNRIEKQVQFLEANPEVILLGSGIIELNQEAVVASRPNQITTDEQIKINLLTNVSFYHPTVMIRSSVLKENPLLRYDPNQPHIEDYDFWIKLIPFGKFANIQEPLLYYRVHQNNISVIHKTEQKERSLVLKRNYLKTLIGERFSEHEITILCHFFDGSLVASSKTQLKYTLELIKVLLNQNISTAINHRIKQLTFFVFQESTKLGWPIIELFVKYYHLVILPKWYSAISLFIKSILANFK